jgi:transposase
LEPNPDRVVDARLDVCPHCAAAFPAEQQTPQQVYDRIELPPIKPDVTRVRLFGGSCACCGARATAPAPSGLEPGSPFGQSIAAMVVYLHYAHAIGLERLAALMGEIFALSISEGAISNLLARAREPLLAAAAAIRATVTASEVVCSDETSARVTGKTWWESQPSPHCAFANKPLNSDAVETARANASMSGSSRCSGMLGINS